jgi:hypothetical protein
MIWFNITILWIKSGVEERSKEWIERRRERSGRKEQRMDRKRKRAEWKKGAKNG